MASCAFATPLALGKPASPVRAATRTVAAPRFSRAAARRHVLRMSGEEAPAKNAVKEDVKKDFSNEVPVFDTPSFETTVFSDFVDNAQAKIDKLQTQISEVDTEALTEDVKSASVGLVDNAIAGDWLNRGELYGGVQLLFVVLMLRSPGFLDALIGFAVGPMTLLAGAILSGKAAFDLGRKQLSIWPAPVPGAELKTSGLYEYVRHPVYAGLLLASMGYAAATGSPERIALALGLGLFLAKKIAVEEEFLLETYPDYSAYQETVKHKLIPGIW